MLRTLNVLFLIALFSLFSFGQKGTHTPYSSFGLGELKGNDYAAFRAMGGVSMANSDSTMINQQNPASYVFIERNRPILQVGINGRFSRFDADTNSTKQRFFGVNQFQLGIPIKKRWGAAFGLKPYSFTGYQISNYVVEDGDSTKLYTNEGSGGINDFYLGVAYKPLRFSYTKKKERNRKDSIQVYADTFMVYREHVLSFGANANYLFGSAKKIKTFQYWTSSLGLNSKVDNSLRFRGVTYDIGLNYQYKFGATSSDKKEKHFSTIAIGASYSPRIGVTAYQDLITYSYLNIGGGFNGPELISDTVDYINNNKGKVYIPENFRFGVEYRIGPKSIEHSSQLRIGVDVRYQRWSTYDERFGTGTYVNNMKDRMNIGFGLEWTPITIVNRNSSYLGKIRYRLGANYLVTEWNILNNLNNYTNLTSYGMSFGVGLPIDKQSNTNINLGANFGTLGTTDNGLIKETYIGAFFGISISPQTFDRWFIKRKYD